MMSDILERIMQGLHIAIIGDVGMTLTNAEAKQLLDELTALASDNVKLRRQVESAKAWIPQWAQEDDPAEDEAWKNL